VTFWVFKVQWLHFAGQMDKSNIAYFRFLQDFVYQNLFKLVHFWLSYSRNNRVAFFVTRCIICSLLIDVWCSTSTMSVLHRELFKHWFALPSTQLRLASTSARNRMIPSSHRVPSFIELAVCCVKRCSVIDFSCVMLCQVMALENVLVLYTHMYLHLQTLTIHQFIFAAF